MIDKPTDKEILVDLFPIILEFRSELISNGVVFPPFVKEDVVQMLIDHRDSPIGFCMIHRGEMGPTSIMVANVFDSPFCKSHRVSQEILWYSRSRVGGVRLLKAYEEWVESMNVTVASIKCIAPDGQSYDKLKNFYSARGFFHLESTFAKIKEDKSWLELQSSN